MTGHFLGPDWVRGEDGVRFRHAARVLLFDAEDRLLLARGHDIDDPARHWWFTIGGGREPGESARDAAVRELREETGLVLPPKDLTGPVLTRTALFDFLSETVRQYEKFFLAHHVGTAPLDTRGWTAVEHAMMDDLRWWDLEELARQDEQVYPEGLAEIAKRLVDGWDGEVVHLGEVHDPK